MRRKCLILRLPRKPRQILFSSTKIFAPHSSGEGDAILHPDEMRPNPRPNPKKKCLGRWDAPLRAECLRRVTHRKVKATCLATRVPSASAIGGALTRALGMSRCFAIPNLFASGSGGGWDAFRRVKDCLALPPPG